MVSSERRVQRRAGGRQVIAPEPSDFGGPSLPNAKAFAATAGSAAPNGGADYTLHGFSFASSEARQAAAEGHHLWAAFIAFTLKQGYDGEPTMDDSRDRELFEAFVEGGWQEAQQIAKSSDAGKEPS